MDNKRFQDIYSAVTTEVRDTSSSFTTIAKRYSNDGYEEILRRLIQANVVEQFRTWTLTTTAGTRSYQAPYDMGEIVYAIDTTNGKELSIGTESDIYSKYVTKLNTTGSPFLIVPRSQSNMMTQPTQSTTIRLVSDSSSDTSQTLNIRGISGSAEYYESLSYNGTNNVTSSNGYDYLISAVKSGTTVGKSTITYVADSTTAAVISPSSYFENYTTVELYFVPAGTYTNSIRYRRKLKPMVADNDVPVVDCAAGIEYFAIARSWEYKRQLQTATYFMNKFEAWYTEYVNQKSKNMTQQFDIMPYSREY